MTRLLARWVTVVTAGLATVTATAGGPRRDGLVDRVRGFREEHARAIVAELAGLVAVPNGTGDAEGIAANAELLVAMLERRGLAPRLLEVEGAPPVVFAELRASAGARTVVFYAHYDGQPVSPSEWSSPPFAPVLRRGSEEIALDGDAPLDGETRLYGRSVADDKAPIVALLAAIDALEAAGKAPSVNVKLFFEGEEERGSPHLADVLRTYRDDLDADLWVFCDGPAHQTRRPQVVFGVRGVTRLTITAYGPAVPLHSGHYGNWAPDPGMLLAGLVAGMRGPDGTPRIDGLLELVRNPGPTARAAIAAMPPVDEAMRRELELGWTEGGGAPLPERLLLPAINLLGFSTGHVGARAANAIPSEAEAVVGFRLVPDVTPARLRELVEEHVRRRGFTIVRHEPSAAERRAGGRLVRLEWGTGYPALWTSMELPASKAVLRVVSDATGGTAVATPTMGGSLPLYLFDEILAVPVIVLPTVNHDNNQHAADENLRLTNLWDAVDVFAALMGWLGDDWR